MADEVDTVIALERQFWDSLVMNDAGKAVGLLTEPALMVSEHGVMQFDHEQYRKMAEQGPRVLKSYEFSEFKVLFPSPGVAIVAYRVKQVLGGRSQSEPTVHDVVGSATWLRMGSGWKCAAHTETAAKARPQ